ncbi:MAG: orotidine-5'-phosphate decarboxylase [Holophagales bacterium]|nr:orotidine-5'-phosphate decarboxylase [Holophagales bacterium]
MPDTRPSFYRRFRDLARERSPFCCGVDPSDALLEAWDLPRSAAGVGEFCDRLLEAAGESVTLFKPQSAFFERFGPEGVAQLRRFVVRAREQGSLVLLDCKRGDIDSTLEAYAHGLVGRGSPMGADAVTLTAYLGPGTLRPMVERAHTEGAYLFVVVLSSNPEGRTLQDARLGDGRTVAEYLADSISEWNDISDEEVGPVGAVVGATSGSAAASVVERLPRSLFLAPGLGAQGASFEDVRRLFGQALPRVIPTSSRGVLGQGPSVDALRRRLIREQDSARTLWD